MDIRELYWAAGLIEGEGSFSGKGVGLKGHGVSVGQKDKECLVRLQELFGGAIYERTLNNAPFYTWMCGGTLARSLMMTLFSLMTQRRQEQIRTCLAPWIAKTEHGGRYCALRTHCARGHEYTPGSFRVYGKRNVRHCIACKAVHAKTQAAERKQARHARPGRIGRPPRRDSDTLPLPGVG